MCTWFCETFCCFLLRFRLYVLRKLGRGSSDHPDSPRSFEDIHLESVSSRLPPARVHPRSAIGSTTTTVRMDSPRRYQPAYPHATSSLQPEETGGRPAAMGSQQNTAHPLDPTDPRSRSRTPRPQIP
ncbi:hypothetical protein MMC29_008502, partial [Sticta canariensis]|nr:hypothetical protein [Sticta canariensis]